MYYRVIVKNYKTEIYMDDRINDIEKKLIVGFMIIEILFDNAPENIR